MGDGFEALGLDRSLAAALAKENITVPTEIQRKVIPEALKDRDLIVQSETGTGKTLAYLLPLFEKLKTSGREMQAIILAPTHELAIQIQRQIERLVQNSGIAVSSAPIIGGVNIDRQIRTLKEKPHIIVGSAGRILELIKLRKVTAHTVKTIILDEADRLMDGNSLADVKAVVKSTLRERRLMAFSATITQDTIARAGEIMKEPEVITSGGNAQVPPSIVHWYFKAEQRDKIEVLRKLAGIIDPPKALVFAGKGEEAEIAAAKLQYHGMNAKSIHGSDFKLERKKTMDEFRSGKLQLLIASDIAARGLHVEGVTHIFSLNVPEDPRDYLHRVGRTGRGGEAGVAVSIVTDRELPLIRLYEKTLKISISPKDMYKGRITDIRPR